MVARMPSNGAAAASSSGNLTLLATKSSLNLAQQNYSHTSAEASKEVACMSQYTTNFSESYLLKMGLVLVTFIQSRFNS